MDVLTLFFNLSLFKTKMKNITAHFMYVSLSAGCGFSVLTDNDKNNDSNVYEYTVPHCLLSSSLCT
jgi:hypothetical protein